MAERNISMVRGDTLSFGLEFEGLNRNLDTAYFSVKKSMEDEEYVFQKSLNSGISSVGDGKYKVRVAPSDTEDVEQGKYYYDMQIGVNGDTYTIIKGILDIEKGVTE